ncbi:hypothetical protein CKAH01_16315 [Colletotrichum kahawae]|uniref:Uncharacterized protein n=1 Tax=Colletotrichum kahawae TaxID=34407 RepID=A0AAD9YGG5_COLKA|nr:hypothetical protein CKAH01_16315 [Colletotrichum kahawae]
MPEWPDSSPTRNKTLARETQHLEPGPDTQKRASWRTERRGHQGERLLRNSTAQNSDLEGAGIVRTQASIFKLVFGCGSDAPDGKLQTGPRGFLGEVRSMEVEEY